MEIGTRVRTPDGEGVIVQQQNPEWFVVEIDGIEDEYTIDEIQVIEKPRNPTNPSWASAREARIRRTR